MNPIDYLSPSDFYGDKTCPECDGHGECIDWFNRGCGYDKCPVCEGKGCIEKPENKSETPST